MPRPRKKPPPKPPARRSMPQLFLDSAGITKKVVEYRPLAVIFAQGDPGDSVMYIQKGAVRLSVLSHAGKEAIVGVLGTGDFLGEGALAGQPIRMGTATAVSATSVLVVPKKQMIQLLHDAAGVFRPLHRVHALSATSASKKISSISCSTRARSAWRARSCCWRATARRTNRRAFCRSSRRKCLRK